MECQYPGVYSGLVENNRDPDRLGRIKVRVPAIYGSPSQISTNSLPWALPRGLPAGMTEESGGVDWLPESGDTVWVTFLDGEPEKPLWEWAGQSQDAARKFKLHAVDKDGKPKRSALTRYGHTIEFNPPSITLVTKGGNALLLDDGIDGAIFHLKDELMVLAQELTAILDNVTLTAEDTVFVEAVQALAFKSTNLAATIEEDAVLHCGGLSIFVTSNSGSSMATFRDGRITISAASGAAIAIDGSGNMAMTTPSGTSISADDDGTISLMSTEGTSVVVSPGNISISSGEISIKASSISMGEGAVSTVPLTDPLLVAFNTHVHKDSTGGLTTPPIVPITPQMVGSTTILAK